MRACELIQELASQPYKHRWVSPTEAEFSTGSGKDFRVWFTGRGSNHEMFFLPREAKTSDPFARTEDFDSFRVFSTVLTVLSEFLDRRPRIFVYFLGNDFFQTRLYLRGLDRYGGKFGIRWRKHKGFIYTTKKGNLYNL